MFGKKYMVICMWDVSVKNVPVHCVFLYVSFELLWCQELTTRGLCVFVCFFSICQTGVLRSQWSKGTDWRNCSKSVTQENGVFLAFQMKVLTVCSTEPLIWKLFYLCFWERYTLWFVIRINYCVSDDFKVWRKCYSN